MINNPIVQKPDQGASNMLPDELYKIAASHLRLPSKVANFGCGSHFSFERVVHNLSPETILCSYDITDPQQVPDFLHYETRDLTQPFCGGSSFDAVTFFELIEHVDQTDMILKNVYNNLKEGGRLIFSFPNLAGLLCRVNLILGYQPHILEVSNLYGNFGAGPIGRLSNPNGTPVHHVRGITLRAMIELVRFHGFAVKKIIPYEFRIGRLPRIFAGLAPVIIMVCEKSKSA